VGQEGRLIADPATPLEHFPPTLGAARARIAAVRPSDYARSRNALDGAVTRLSPYVTHGLVGLPEVLAGVVARHRVDVQHKFVQELGWREYFRHAWSHRGDGILESLHEGPLPERAYARDLPRDVREARTGVPVVDASVRALYATGYLHNHARMWVASYVVHLRKVHWRAGADWMLAHLLDGDLASNHLSWQWVAGTASRKPYLFNAENVARYAPAEWRSEGTVVDTTYEALDAIARDPRPVPCTPRGEGVEEPALHAAPVDPGATAPRAADVAGRDVWLVHPWALGEPPAGLPEGCLHVGWWPVEHHAAWPWSATRWAFAGTRMAAIAPVRWHGDGASLGRALAGARSVTTWAEPHVSALLPRVVVQREPVRLFAEVERPCASFSAWWGRCTGGVRRVEQLPGLAAVLATRGTP
jgi:deoxyribodipyrimidine photo-lyase